jgi:hypothetical protein
MGTWAAGVYGNDAALDWMGDLMDSLSNQIKSEIDDFDESNGDSLFAAIDTIAILCGNTLAAPPKSTEVDAWQKSYVRCWKSYITELDPDPDYLEGQGKVIDDVFSRLSKLSSAFWETQPA